MQDWQQQSEVVGIKEQVGERAKQAASYWWRGSEGSVRNANSKFDKQQFKFY